MPTVKIVKYSEWSPTAHDAKGLNLPDKQDWLVAPVTLNRDADAISRSNWRVFTRMLEELSEQNTDIDNWETARFGHWACGWFTIVLVHPRHKAWLESIAEQLDGYPILDEWDLAKVEEQDHVNSECGEGCSLCESEECDGHPAGPSDPMGQTVYCDGSCKH